MRRSESAGWQGNLFHRRTVFTLLLWCSTVCPAFGATELPEILVREIFDELLLKLDEQRQADTLTDEAVIDTVATFLNPRIDYPYLSRWILREHWVGASEEQRSAFRTVFERYIINTYALALASDKQVQLDVDDNSLRKNNAAVVSAAISIAGSNAVPLQFRLINRDEQWLLFDVSLSGVSLARTFRSDFSYVAKKGGIDAVIAHLTQRLAGS